MARPNSIEAIGLENHINNGRDEQNGNGYYEFIAFVQAYTKQGKVPNFSAIGVQFNRDGQTIRKWFKEYAK